LGCGRLPALEARYQQSGERHECLKLSVDRIPRRDRFADRQQLLQAAPRNLASPERAARTILQNHSMIR
jgi:hypothetical protein